MHTMRLLSFFFCIILFTGCRVSGVKVLWRNAQALPGRYNTVLVAAVTGDADSLLRQEIEQKFTSALRKAGYRAFSSRAEYGTDAFRGLDQEETYKNLCDRGIDALFTVALVEINKHSAAPREIENSPITYYYQLIWNYKKQNALLTTIPDTLRQNYCWEVILFDLSTLQPHYIARTSAPFENWQLAMNNEFWNDIVFKLRRDKFLEKRDPIIEGPRAF
jgi:hypothetical protein